MLERSTHSAAVVTVSDRSARGERADTSGPLAVAALRGAGFACDEALVVPDGADHVEAALRALVAGGVRVVVTTGGTGVAPRDQTPEGTLRVIDRELPGIAEELRRRGAQAKPLALVSRGRAGVAASTLIVNLPGSTSGVAEGMPLITSLAGHIIDQLDGGDH
ncbi:MogA/MoaB family molybdenum cofactor biosynthesis protein [Microbacterium hominis]|uniref:MogA/MoaB family molybdenum cofactor biosynthesis protein n=1 Tax=Microbacterium hominis TaxID=162426 RepID=A0A7D4TLZ8_9MICO|nr:MogA/MoaB family molybdenum cofactor biosynthesis protein [Microbacterium hominis]QKJ18682.1 MogA/MoaB family molybdenum cofactor biosynthesis protein [Microbacterium hominis]